MTSRDLPAKPITAMTANRQNTSAPAMAITRLSSCWEVIVSAVAETTAAPTASTRAMIERHGRVWAFTLATCPARSSWCFSCRSTGTVLSGAAIVPLTRYRGTDVRADGSGGLPGLLPGPERPADRDHRRAAHAVDHPGRRRVPGDQRSQHAGTGWLLTSTRDSPDRVARTYIRSCGASGRCRPGDQSTWSVPDRCRPIT